MRSGCFPLPEDGLSWGHSGAWAPQGAGSCLSSPRGCDTHCSLVLGLPRPHLDHRTQFILQHLNRSSWFSHSLPSPMHIFYAAERWSSFQGGKLLSITTKRATNPGPRARLPVSVPARLRGVCDGARWHLRFLATQVFLPASFWPLIFLAPSPCRSSDLFTPARISEVQMYMCFALR